MVRVIVSDENDFNHIISGNHVARTFDDEESANEFIEDMRDLKFNVLVWYPRRKETPERDD